MRTNGRFEAKTPATDGFIFYSAINSWAQAGTGVLTRTAAGDVAMVQPASQTGLIVLPLDGVLKKLGMQPFLQEQYGTAAGVAGPTAVANTTDTDGNSMAPYYPPFTKVAMPTITGGEAGYVPKGLQINDITVIYSIATASLTSVTCRLDKTTFVNAAAISVTPVIASAQNGLSLTFSANKYVTKILNPAPAFNVVDNSTILFEIAPVTPASSVFSFYGLGVHFSFNYN